MPLETARHAALQFAEKLDLGLAFGSCTWVLLLGLALGSCFWVLLLGLAFGSSLLGRRFWVAQRFTAAINTSF